MSVRRSASREGFRFFSRSRSATRRSIGLALSSFPSFSIRGRLTGLNAQCVGAGALAPASSAPWSGFAIVANANRKAGTIICCMFTRSRKCMPFYIASIVPAPCVSTMLRRFAAEVTRLKLMGQAVGTRAAPWVIDEIVWRSQRLVLSPSRSAFVAQAAQPGVPPTAQSARRGTIENVGGRLRTESGTTRRAFA